MELLEMLRRGASLYPHKAAVIDEGEVLTYGRLLRASRGLGAAIAASTDRPFVGIFLPSGRAFAVAYLGVLMAGKAAMPYNFLLPDEEIAFITRDAEIDTVITARAFLAALGREALFASGRVRLIFLDEIAASPWRRAQLALRGLFFRAPEVPPHAIATLLYTSGTTGKPRGVCLTHHNLASNVDQSRRAIDYRSEDVLVQALPMFHSFALTVTLLLPLACGSTAIALKRFSPEALLDLMERYRSTYAVLIPSQYRVLIRAQEMRPRHLPCLRRAISGGEPLPGDVRRRFAEVFAFEILEGYGLSEASPVVSLNPSFANRPGSVGKPLPEIEARIAADDESILGPGEIGELQIRGPNVTPGYHRRPEETAALFAANRWLRTGDMARIDKDGYIWIVGRKKEMIKVAGEAVYPAEVEDALSLHPAVAEVGVAGVPDQRHGEVPKAFVVRREGAAVTGEELIRFARQHLPRYAVPHAVVFCAELPKGPTGKVLRRRLAEEGGKSAAGVR